MSARSSFVVLLTSFVLAACGGDDGNATPDAASVTDSATASVVEVTPCTGENATVTADPSDSAGSYTPPTTAITQGQVVKFVMPAAHNVVPHTTMPSDPALNVGFGQTKCFRFTQTGSFNFYCSPHGFRGTITVN